VSIDIAFIRKSAMNDQKALMSEKHLWSALMMTLCTTKPHIKQIN